MIDQRWYGYLSSYAMRIQCTPSTVSRWTCIGRVPVFWEQSFFEKRQDMAATHNEGFKWEAACIALSTGLTWRQGIIRSNVEGSGAAGTTTPSSGISGEPSNQGRTVLACPRLGPEWGDTLASTTTAGVVHHVTGNCPEPCQDNRTILRTS